MQDEGMKLRRETNRTADTGEKLRRETNRTGEKQNRTHTDRKLPK